MNEEVLKFIDWLEGRYNPNTPEEEDELINYGEIVFPILMHKFEKFS